MQPRISSVAITYGEGFAVKIKPLRGFGLVQNPEKDSILIAPKEFRGKYYIPVHENPERVQ